YGIGMDVDQYGFQYNFGYASNQIDYFGQTINKGLFLTKQGDTGIPVWVVQFPDADYISSTLGNYIVVDTNTNSVYITGTFYNPLVIPGGPTLIPDLEGSIYILKFDLDGNYQWAVQEDFISSNNLCLSCDNLGNVLLSGVFFNSINIGSSTLVSAGVDDVFIAKYDNSGQFVWAKRAGGEGWEWDCLISTDGQGNVYLTGEFTSHDVTVDDYAITLEDGDGNILFAKFDPQGNVQWVTVKGGSSVTWWGDYYGWPTGIHTDLGGYSYIKGWHADSASFDNIMLASMFNNPDYNNRWNKFVAKFDTDGNTIWAKSISELSYSYDYNQFDVNQNGNVYSGLRVMDTTLFGDDFMYVNTGKYDLLVVNYSNDGELNWIKSIEDSESGTTWISSIACYDEETAFVCGWFNDYLDFGATSFEANNKNGFIGVLGETSGITVYQRDDETILFDLFPNPAHQEVSILLNDDSLDEVDLLITDITGREVYSQPLTKGQPKTTVDLSEFSPGIYFAKVKSGKKVAVKKFVVD
ncbi:MAG: T9SS type A sorting domain-containing protein, partial [Bacteroidales bacterium]|nr:T9SS type A sorting domain-containing protein [Bacteroidales bacterium]